jgi:hypothetical protein
MQRKLVVFALGVLVGFGLFAGVRLAVKGLPPKREPVPVWAQKVMVPIQFTCPPNYVLYDFDKRIPVVTPTDPLNTGYGVAACLPERVVPASPAL